MTRPRILAAIAAEAIPELYKAVGEEFEIVPVHALYDAIRQLQDQHIDLILCGMFFDESRMFDLLRFVRANFPAIPFATCRVLAVRPAPSISLEAVQIGAEALGAAGFINLPDLERLYGDQKYERFRGLLRKYLSGPAPDA
jgi:hypothetical protein